MPSLTTIRVPQRRHLGINLVLAVTFLPLGVIAGCSQFIDPNVPEPIRPFVEPEHNSEYLLYRPSNYDRNYTWPLVIVCHGAYPDSPNRRLRAWTQQAEADGFLVAAPRLTAIPGLWATKPDKQIPLQRADETRILSVIRNIQASHNISADRIFIHGWAGGSHSALHTGLRHSELFRAVAVSQPKHNEAFLVDVEQIVDLYQPILVNYSMVDTLTGKHAQRCIEWLRERGADLTERSSSSGRGDDTDSVVEFFEEVIRRKPWVHIRALPGGDDSGLRIRFKLKCSFAPARFVWKFGDGEQSVGPDPVHLYTQPGTFPVSVTLTHPNGDEHHRTALLTVPDATISRTRAAPSEPRP